MDDKLLSDWVIDDLKAFLDVGEDSTATARYTDAVFCKNGMRAVADNEFDPDDEPEDDGRLEITDKEFFTMVQKSFGYKKETHVYAVLKRAIVVIAGQRALYFPFGSRVWFVTDRSAQHVLSSIS